MTTYVVTDYHYQMASLVLRSPVVRALIALCVVGVAHLVQVQGTSRFSAELFNAGHVVLMGAFSLVMLSVTRDLLGARAKSPWIPYIHALWVTIAVGTLSEIAQIPGPRDADVLDVIRDAAGAFCFLSLWALRDESLAAFWSNVGDRWRTVVRLSVFVTLLVAWAPALVWGAVFWHRTSMFPMLCTFDSYWETPLWTTANASLETTSPPSGWNDAPHGLVGHMTCRPSVRAGFAINQVYPDWRNFDRLEMDIYLASDSGVAFVIQVEDQHSLRTREDRFTFRGELAPGPISLVVPLSLTEQIPSGRSLDLSRIKTAYFYTTDTTRTISLYMDNIRLRRAFP